MVKTEKPEVKCNMCEWEGMEDDLELLYDGEYYNGCPKCKTDAYLMDIE